MLNRKMFRDIRKNLSQFITIFLMVMIGIMAFSGIKAYMDGMSKTADKFYTENNLQDMDVMGYLNHDDLEVIKKIDNVNDAELKLSVTGLTDNDKTLLLNFIESNNISKFYIIDGEGFDNKSGVWLDEFYARENNIKVGDVILVKYETMELHEKVRALVNIPDHLYDVRDSSELYPDRKEFGFAYVSVNEITEDYIKSKAMKEAGIEDKKVFDMVVPDFDYKKNIPFSSIMVDVKDKDKRNKVKEEIEDKVENAKAIINIEDSSSYSAYQGEIDEGKTYVGVFSGILDFPLDLGITAHKMRLLKAYS